MGSIVPSDVVAVIPARYASQRFPGKLLVPLGGKPVLAHVVAAAMAADRVGTVLVATDHQALADVAADAGAEAVMTDASIPTGSDRVGVAVVGRSEDVVLNLQGDEPLVAAAEINQLVELLEADPTAAVSTLACSISAQSEEHRDPNVVKVVATGGRALYFSRAPIPGHHPGKDVGSPEGRGAWRHVGLYGFRRAAFEKFLRHEPTPLELAEGLEQLRFLESGETIVVGEVLHEMPPGIDTPQDLQRCEEWIRSRA